MQKTIHRATVGLGENTLKILYSPVTIIVSCIIRKMFLNLNANTSVAVSFLLVSAL